MQLVSSSAAVVENDENVVGNITQDTISNNMVNQATSNNTLVSNDDQNAKTENVVETSSSSSTSNYFSELKMSRDEMYSKSLETYQKIVDSEGISTEQKAIAIQEIEKINNTKNAIEIAEELIKLKDFEDVVIYSSNEQISVIVRIAALSESQVAQIQNIVSKELGVEVGDITISNK